MAESDGGPGRGLGGHGLLDVHVVTPEREVWAGEATFVVVRASDGELGVLPGHEPLLAVLRQGPLKVETQGETFTATVDGGFLSVGGGANGTRVDVLAEQVTDIVDGS